MRIFFILFACIFGTAYAYGVLAYRIHSLENLMFFMFFVIMTRLEHMKK